ncbi:MAG: DUF6599 family protein [Syntrophobacteraceae bacterium]
MPTELRKTETFICGLVLATLAAIALGIFIRQFRFDPAVFTAIAPNGNLAAPSSQASSGPSEFQTFMPQGLTPLTPPETFGPDNLSDKINGKAELYLSAGFVSLQCRRFYSITKGTDAWIEFFVYDMGNPRNAFSVFSTQRRADAVQIDLARHAYKTANALFFVHGPIYVEVVSAVEGMDDEMLSAGMDFIESGPAPPAEQADESSFFPSKHLLDGSISLHTSDVFGFSGLENVFTAGYDIGGLKLTAFLSRKKTPRDASEAAYAYHRFLSENGGKDLEPGIDIPGVKLIRIFDTFELIFIHNELLAGVHEAESETAAKKLALMLYKKLLEADR